MSEYTNISDLPDGHPDKILATTCQEILRVLAASKLTLFQDIVVLSNVRSNILIHFSGKVKDGSVSGSPELAADINERCNQFVFEILSLEMGEEWMQRFFNQVIKFNLDSTSKMRGQKDHGAVKIIGIK